MVVLDGLVLQLPSGDVRPPLSATLKPGVTLVCGDEGTGKSTLLRVLGDEAARQQAMRAGQIIWDTDPHETSHVFLMDPADATANDASVRDYWQHQAKRYPAWREDVLQALVQSLGLTEHVHKSIFMLSTGSRRKVMLAASIASMAPWVLWDQPFASLDLASVRILKEVLKEAATAQRGFVLADYTAPEGVPLIQTLNLG